MKKLLVILGILFGLVIIAALVVPRFISSDAVKRTLIEKIQASTGRTLAINGPFSVRFFPIAGVTMEQVTVINPPSYGDREPLATAQSLKVDVAVLPLLHGDVEIKGLVLDAPQIHLHVNSAGVKNWLPPAKKEAATGMPAAPAKPARSSSEPMVLPSNLRLSDVEIKNGLVTYLDDVNKSHWDLKNVNASVGLSGISSAFTVKGSGDWSGKPVKVNATIDSLSHFLNHTQSDVDAELKSELINVSAKGAINHDVFVGKADINSPSLKNLIAWVNPGSKPASARPPLALTLTSDIECSARQCNATNASLKLDDLAAKGTIKALLGERPNLDIDITTGKLDLNPFLEEKHANADGLFIPNAEAAAAPWNDAPINFPALQSFDATASIKTDGIQWRQISIGKTELRGKLQHGRLSADVVDADLYNGKGNISVVLDAATSGLDTQAYLKGVEAGPLLHDAAGISNLSGGTADVQISTAGHGRSEREIISSLSGNGKLKLTNGTVSGVNLLDMMHNVTSAFTQTGGGQKTPINDLSGSFTIVQGVIHNNDLVIAMPSLRVAGQGDINLPAYTVHYRLTPQTVGVAQGGKAAEGLGVPVVVDGTLDHLTYRPDVGSVLQEAIKNPKQFQEQLKNNERSIKEQLKGGKSGGNTKDVLKGLKGLLKGQ